MSVPDLPSKPGSNIADLSRRILEDARAGTPRVEFFKGVTSLLLEFMGCDELEVDLRDGGLRCRVVATRLPKVSYRFAAAPEPGPDEAEGLGSERGLEGLDRLCRAVLEGRVDTSRPGFTRSGSFWTGDLDASALRPASGPPDGSGAEALRRFPHKSLAIVRFALDPNTAGLMLFMSRRPGVITKEQVELCEGLGHTISLAVVDRRVHADLRERVKELTCLYGIAKAAEQPGLSLRSTLNQVVELLPPAWQFAAEARARIVLDGQTWETAGFEESRHAQTADIVVMSRHRGRVEVVYPESALGGQESPFLAEEQHLIEAVAREIGLIVYRKDSEERHDELQTQLRHADRLATIGQLAAGIAHELNEPLGGILGFAQLARKSADLPEATDRDLEKIVAAALHAREVVRKLLHFARRMPTKRTYIQLRDVIEEGLAILEPRCAKAGIELRRDLAEGLPEVDADASQIQQVLLNLVVNAIQAMPAGGRLTVQTQSQGDWILLAVEDTGVGIDSEVQDQLFIPFFTTKPVGEGTGLGLPVVHGIVTAHGGSIRVESQAGEGSRFEIRLPAAGSPAAPAEAEDAV